MRVPMPMHPVRIVILVLVLVLGVGCSHAFSVEEHRRQLADARARSGECMSALETTVGPLLTRQRLRAHGEQKQVEQRERACWRGDRAACSKLLKPYLERGRDAHALAIADMLCQEERIHCALALLLMAKTDQRVIDASQLPTLSPGPAADGQRRRREVMLRLLRQCRTQDGAACLRLSNIMPLARPYLLPRACVWGSEQACVWVHHRYGDRGAVALGTLEPLQAERIMVPCPRQTPAACATFYERRADALRQPRSDDEARGAERHALYRAACDADPGRAVSACGKVAGFGGSEVENLHFRLRACRAGRCDGLASHLRSYGQGTAAHRALGDGGACSRALFEKLCLEGGASTCRFLAGQLERHGYSVGYDPALAKKLQNFADSLADGT